MSLENQSDMSRSMLGGKAYRLLFETGQTLLELGIINYVSLSTDHDVHGHYRINDGLIPKAMGEKVFNGLLLHVEAHIDCSNEEFMQYRARFLDEAKHEQTLNAFIADFRTGDRTDSLTKTRWDSKSFAELLIKGVEFDI